MNLPKLTDLEVSGKRVLLRADLDVDIDIKTGIEDIRLKSIISTLEYLVEKNSEVIIIGHRGRPGGKIDEKLSLEPVSKVVEKLFKEKIGEEKMKSLKMYMLENLRFDPGEEANSGEFTKHLAEKGDVYVNEAFANSHREHASIVGLPKLLPHAAGFRFAREVENLSKVFNPSTGSGPKRPVLFIIGGSKKDKLDYVEDAKKTADKILVGGKLPEYMGDNTVSVRSYNEKEKVIVANLTMDREDITLNSIERFEEEISKACPSGVSKACPSGVGKAGTIVLAGPMGKYEDEGHRQGTERIFKAVAKSGAYKVVGGEDSLVVSQLFDLVDKFDWVSVGGGAMLEFLTKGTLPGIEALSH
ncbi:MAG: phosphoglycerate kinase [bacterium]|nr:phosphoglycerate kinase [bacterium]